VTKELRLSESKMHKYTRKCQTYVIKQHCTKYIKQHTGIIMLYLSVEHNILYWRYW